MTSPSEPIDYARTRLRTPFRSFLRRCIGLHLVVLPFLILTSLATLWTIRPPLEQLRFGRRASTDVRVAGQRDHLDILITTISGPDRSTFSHHPRAKPLDDELYWEFSNRLQNEKPEIGRFGWRITSTLSGRRQTVFQLARDGSPAGRATHRYVRIPAYELAVATSVCFTLFGLFLIRHWRRLRSSQQR